MCRSTPDDPLDVAGFTSKSHLAFAVNPQQFVPQKRKVGRRGLVPQIDAPAGEAGIFIKNDPEQPERGTLCNCRWAFCPPDRLRTSGYEIEANFRRGADDGLYRLHQMQQGIGLHQYAIPSAGFFVRLAREIDNPFWRR